MPFTRAETRKFRELVDRAKRPLIFYDDDCDGVSSYVMLTRSFSEFRGVPVKKTPELNAGFARKVREYDPDIVFVLDKPMISSDFFDEVRVPIVWLDHHPPQNPAKHCTYFNPRNRDDADNRPTSYWVWRFVGKPEDSWIAAIGVVGDWFVPDFLPDVKEQYPGLLPRSWKGIETLYTGTRLSELIMLLNFMLKGSTTETITGVKVLLKIRHPDEILKQTTPRGKYLWKRFQRYAKQYYVLLKRARTHARKKRGKYLVYVYEDDANSFTRELSNELLILYPKRITIVGRKHRGEVKASIRSAGPIIRYAVEQALDGVRGHGGGHNCAAGCAVHEDDWEKFLQQFKDAMKKQK